MPNSIDNMSTTVGATSTPGGGGGTWFEAMATAWGEALDAQADRIVKKSDQMNNDGGDKPADVTELTAMSLQMSFLASSSHTAISSVGAALETMARKQ
jgi:hypothetical protein